MTHHEQLVETAEKAVRAIFSDISVDKRTTAESLRAVIDEAEACLDTLGVG